MNALRQLHGRRGVEYNSVPLDLISAESRAGDRSTPSAHLPEPAGLAILPARAAQRFAGKALADREAGNEHGPGPIVVGSLEVSFAVFASPPPDTVTVFVTDAGAFVVTFATTAISGYEAPAPRTSERVQVRVAKVQVHPAPAIAVAIRRPGAPAFLAPRRPRL